MNKESAFMIMDYQEIEHKVAPMYQGLEIIATGFLMMLTVVTAPFILEGKLLNSLDRYLWSKGWMDWNPEYAPRKELI